MVGEFREEWFGRWLCKKAIRRGPDKHIEGGDKRNINQQPGSKRLRSEANFFKCPGAEILERENVTTPAADKTAEDQRGQMAREKKMKPAFTNPLCNVYIVSEGSIGETVLPINRH